MNSKELILIIDDDGEWNHRAHQALGEGGYRVVSCADEAAGLAHAATLSPALIILAANLRAGDGYSLCRRLRAESRTADTPLLMLSACVEEEDVVYGLGCGADDVASRTLGAAELLVLARNLIRRSGCGALVRTVRQGQALPAEQDRSAI